MTAAQQKLVLLWELDRRIQQTEQAIRSNWIIVGVGAALPYAQLRTLRSIREYVAAL